jgi:ParB family chromosome partitioning protein
MTGSAERPIRTETVQIPKVRTSFACDALGASIRDEGLRRPITLWKDGTLISGGRRLLGHLLVGRPRIQAVYVHTIEDAAKRLLADNQDSYLAAPMKWSEVCRLWEILRRLDAPAAVKRVDEARRRGVELRRLTLEGKRKPGRVRSRSEDYMLSVACEPFGISEATAKRIETIYGTGYGTLDATDEKRELAREIMADIDAGSPVWPNYQRLMGERTVVSRPRAASPAEPAAATVQRSAWTRALPQMEGLVAGLTELGPTSPALTWDQVGPVHDRLMAVRRDLEKIIKQMRESNQP